MKNTRLELLDSKLVEVKATIASLKKADIATKDQPKKPGSITKSTRGTQLYKYGRERRILCLIRSLVEQLGDKITLSEADQATFALITTLSTERQTLSKIMVQEGDVFLDILQKYADRKTDTVVKNIEKAGLKVDYTTGKLVHA